MTTADASKAGTLGCNQGNFDRNSGNINSEVVLDFGAQSSGLTGTYFPATSTYISYADIETAVERFAANYYTCTSSDTTSTVYLEVGTNNSGSNVSTTAGQSWAGVVNTIKNWVYANGIGQVVIQGANDMEPGWNSYSNTVNWANGYDGATSALYLNFGSADGCSQTSYGNNSCNNSWNTYDVWKISWGVSAAITAPEIYYSANAAQWWRISQYGYYYQGGAVYYTAPWDQYDLATNTLTSQGAWDALESDLYQDSHTAAAPGYSMEIHRE